MARNLDSSVAADGNDRKGLFVSFVIHSILEDTFEIFREEFTEHYQKQNFRV